jgi:hypothetical protein
MNLGWPEHGSGKSSSQQVFLVGREFLDICLIKEVNK